MVLSRVCLAVTLIVAAAAACGRPALAPKVPAVEAASPSPAAQELPVRQVDELLREEWAKRGLEPSAPVDDARFYRRVSIDIVGAPPRAEEVEAFLRDPSPDKRQRVVDTLLASPGYAERWAAYWDEVLMGRDERRSRVDRQGFRRWLQERIGARTPWDQLVRELVAAAGPNGAVASGAGASSAAPPASGNPAVNWVARYAATPTDLAGLTSRVFLGVQIQCAQCHDHKTEAWRQVDFQRFAACFTRVQVQAPRGPGASHELVVRDTPGPAPRLARDGELAAIVRASPAALDGQALTGARPREALARWMTAPDNPYFARAFVNRMWGHFLGRGFVDPVDDLRPSNAPTLPALYDLLARDFVEHGYDVPRLLRIIVASEAYARSSGPAQRVDAQNALWARFRLVPLGPEELLSSVFVAGGLDAKDDGADAPALDALRAQLSRQYGFLFDVDEEQDHEDYEGSVPQALALLNGPLIQRAATRAAAVVLARNEGDGRAVELLYLRILGRYPTPSEARTSVAAINSGGRRGRGAAYEDLAWALFNSSEFVFNH